MLPDIFVTKVDRAQLERVLETFSAPRYEVLTQFLARELGRAEIVDSTVVPPDVVTMSSRVRFRMDETRAAREATVVYPGHENSLLHKVSVLMPVGSAMLGLTPGRRIDWRDLSGQLRSLTVLDVLYQPEAHGVDLH